MPNELKLIKASSYLSVIISIIILAIKTYGYSATESQSMLGSLVDSMLDISSSLINFFAIRIAFQPPDHNHRFGHEKFQDLAIFSQSVFFFASSILIFVFSVKAMLLRVVVTNQEQGLQVMYYCMALVLFLVCYQTYVIKKTNSQIILADRLHYFSDFLTNFAVLISIYFSGIFWWIDALCGIAISIYITYTCYSLFRTAIRNLVDEEMPNQEREKILSIINNYKEIKGIHDFKTRYAGDKPFIQFHLEMDGSMSLNDAHQISENICFELLTVFPKGEIIIHQDPLESNRSDSHREIFRV